MADYNTFVVVDCKSRNPALVTTSARKAKSIFESGKRVDVWNNNNLVQKIRYTKREKGLINPYIQIEKEYIREKQAKAEMRNKKRKYNV